MATTRGSVFFEDQTIRYMDSDTSRSSNEGTDCFPNSRSLSGFDWKQNQYDPVIELDGSVEDNNSLKDSATEVLVKTEHPVEIKTNSMVSSETVVEDDIEVAVTQAKGNDSQTDGTDLEGSSPKKSRNFRDILCSGFSRIVEEILALVHGRDKDNEGDDVEYGPVRYVPHSLSTLTQTTNFTKDELKTMYRTFKNECPTGVLYEETFKSIYSQFFPSGDSNMYAHFLFNAFDMNQEGYICFEDFVSSLSCLLRGKFEEKLEWIFKIYDTNHDGYITLEEMQDIVQSVYSMLGTPKTGVHSRLTYAEHAKKIFQKMDENNDGYVTYPEFVAACTRDSTIIASMRIFEEEE